MPSRVLLNTPGLRTLCRGAAGGESHLPTLLLVSVLDVHPAASRHCHLLTSALSSQVASGKRSIQDYFPQVNLTCQIVERAPGFSLEPHAALPCDLSQVLFPCHPHRHRGTSPSLPPNWEWGVTVAWCFPHHLVLKGRRTLFTRLTVLIISLSPSCSKYIGKLLGICGASRTSWAILNKPQLLRLSLECEVLDASCSPVFIL